MSKSVAMIIDICSRFPVVIVLPIQLSYVNFESPITSTIAFIFTRQLCHMSSSPYSQSFGSAMGYWLDFQILLEVQCW